MKNTKDTINSTRLKDAIKSARIDFEGLAIIFIIIILMALLTISVSPLFVLLCCPFSIFFLKQIDLTLVRIRDSYCENCKTKTIIDQDSDEFKCLEKKDGILSFKSSFLFFTLIRVPFSGLIVSHYKDDRLHFKKIYKGIRVYGLLNDKLNLRGTFQNSQPDGVYEQYYNNGQLRFKATLKDGKLDGVAEHYYYYKDSQLLLKKRVKSGQFEKEENYGEEEELDSVWEQYEKNTQLKSKETYKYGKRNGAAEKYYNDGELKSKRTYNKGRQVGDYESYLENGQLDYKGTLKYINLKDYYGNGYDKEANWFLEKEKYSKWYYDENGNLKYKGTIVDLTMLELFGQEEIPKRGARTWLETMLSVYHD